MVGGNQTAWAEFILVGFSELPHLRVPLFAGFFVIYLFIIGSNLLVMSVIYSDPRLHTPMYFFLTNLSFVEISYTSVLFPKMLTSLFLLDTRIFLWECLFHLYLFMVMIATEFFILTIMSYDRYVAVCHPLHYTVKMNKSMCFQLATGAWFVGFMEPIFHIVELSKFSYCDSHKINHFFCEFAALLKLSCTSTSTIEKMTFILGVVVLISSCVLIVTSYVKIISAILQIRTMTQRHKAFSTCVSHLTAVTLFYAIIIFLYIRPTSMYSVDQSKIFLLAYSSIIPMCNPIIYTIKNKEFKDALKRKFRVCRPKI